MELGQQQRSRLLQVPRVSILFNWLQQDAAYFRYI